MKSFQQIFYIIAIIALGCHVIAVPVDVSSTDVVENKPNKENDDNKSEDSNKSGSAPSNTEKDVETSNSHQQPAYMLSEHHTSPNGGSGQFDPSIYASYLTPEAFQQYLAQFAGAIGPYAYPGYGPSPIYPAPYTVQTGYDGILVPSSSTSISPSGTVANTSGSIFSALTNFIPTIMESTTFRVIVTIIGAILVIFFGAVVSTAICNLTPLCDISFKAATYLRGSGAGDVGRMMAKEITPERVKRATEYVHSAIQKYKEMQNTAE